MKKNRKRFYRVLSALMGLLFILMAFSFEPIKVEAASEFDAFPYSYRAKLKELKNKYPNWTFIPLNTGLEWEKVVSNEMLYNRNLVDISVKESWKSKASGDYDPATNTYIGKSGKNWVSASKECVEYHLNPINYFDEQHIFAFQQLYYDASIQNVDVVEAVIANSWMSQRPLEDQPNSGFNYSNFFIQNAIDSGVDPCHLASRVLQEMGRGDVKNKTNSNPLISGKDGVYNYYNYGASGETRQQIIDNGIKKAKQEGWTTRSKALSGGAQKIWNDWIKRGQDSVFLQKFNVDNSDNVLYSHQYMQNIQAPMSESGIIYRAYEKTGKLNSTFVFEIPVYKNMPNSEPPVNEEKVREFVRRLYSLCLDREPDEAGIDSWTELLVNREMTGTEVASGFIFSDEFKNKNYCNSCYVKQLYKAFLNREYDDAGLQVWTDILASGKNREYVFNGFVLSEEFKGICADYGIEYGNGINDNVPGTMPNGDCQGCGAKDNTVQFVTRLYNVCLDRDPDEAGLETHCSLLRSHTCSCSEIAYGFIFSEEFINKGFDDATYVEYLYRALMDREADEGGRDFWVGQMAQGATREDIFNGIVLSDEFTNLCNKYGLRR